MDAIRRVRSNAIQDGMALETLQVDLTVVLGKTRLPLERFLRLGRGSVVALDPTEDDHVEILANGLAIAEGKVVVTGSTIGVEVTRLVRPLDVLRTPGATIGDQMGIGAQSPAGALAA